MKLPAFGFALLGLVLLVSGCESLGDSVRAKFNPASTAQYRAYAADQKAVYAAARRILESMGFRITYGGAAQGKINAVNSIQEDDEMRGLRQVAVKVRLSPALEGGTELQVSMTEVIESDAYRGTGFGTETPLQGTPLYAVFLRGVGQALGLPQKD